MNLFLYPEVPTNWSITPEAFATVLRARWSSAQVRFIQNPSDVEALTFDLNGQEGTVSGSLSRAGQVLILEYGSPHDMAEIIVWFRALAPASEDFMMLSEGGGSYGRVTATMDLNQVVATLAGEQSH